MSRVEITPMYLEDIRIVKEIEIKNNLSAWSESDYATEIKRRESITIVAKATKKVIGFLVARLITNRHIYHPYSNNSNSEVEIYNLAVEKQFRRKGIGKNLLDEILERRKSEEIRKIWLEVRQSNQDAIKFYMANGFSVIYQRKNFYNAPNEDALVMKLE